MKLFLSSSLLALLGFLITFTSPLAAQTTAAPKEKKIPFHGKLMAVDGTANTITIEGKTPRVFHLTPTTKITDGSGAPSTLLAAVVGEDVGGSYSKDAAGAMNLFSVRFGAKTGTKAAATAATPTATTPAPVAPAPCRAQRSRSACAFRRTRDHRCPRNCCQGEKADLFR